jgi:hypothetical protein
MERSITQRMVGGIKIICRKEQNPERKCPTFNFSTVIEIGHPWFSYDFW